MTTLARSLLGAVACLLLVGAGAIGCSKPGLIERECIKGRLSSEQADAVNERRWGHLPGYNRDADGECKDCAQAGDRILAARCSDDLEKLTHEGR